MVTNAVFSLLSQSSSGLFSAILTLYLTRALGARGYGDFSLAVGVGTLVATPADFGISAATARFIADHRDSPNRLAAFLADAHRLKAVASVLACGLLAALAGPIAAAYHAPLAPPLRLVAVALLGQNFMFLSEGAFVAVGEMWSYIQVAFGESAMECGSSVLIVVLGGGLVGATAGRALGYVFGAILGVALTARRFRWPSAVRRRGRPPATGRIARFAGPLLLVAATNSLFASIDVLIIGAFLGSRATGLFSAPLRLLTVFGYLGMAVSQGVSPRMSRGGSNVPDGAAFATGIRTLVVLYALLLAPLIVWAKPIVHILLGAQYDGSVSTMRWLSAAVLLGGLAPLVSVSANYLGDTRSRVPLMIAATMLDGLIDVLLVPRIGIISGAIATGLAYAVMVVGHVRICARHVRLPYARLSLSGARALLAAAAMAETLALWGADPGIAGLLLGGVIGVVVFVAVLTVLGELSRSELSLARGWLRARASRTSNQ